MGGSICPFFEALRQASTVPSIALAPRLLMLDEPSQGIMPKLVDEIFQAVKRVRDAGMTVLIVEQRMAECLDIADRAYILQTGRLLMQGRAAEIKVNPDVRKAYLGL